MQWLLVRPPAGNDGLPVRGQLRPAPVPYVLLGKFRFDKRIGAGGMGVVYRAVDSALDRHVAIKTLPGLHQSTRAAFAAKPGQWRWYLTRVLR